MKDGGRAHALVRHPANLSFEEAAATWMMFVTAWGALIELGGLERGDAQRLERAKRFIVDVLAAGALKPSIDRTFAFDDIAEAHRYMEAGAQVGKIVVTV